MPYIRSLIIGALALFPPVLGSTRGESIGKARAIDLRRNREAGPRNSRVAGPWQTRGPRKATTGGPKKNISGGLRALKKKAAEDQKGVEGCIPDSPIRTYESGCPCFRKEDINGPHDLASAEYCDFVTYDDSYGTAVDFYADLTDDADDTYISFGAYKYEESGYNENTCYAGVWLNIPTDEAGVEVSTYFDVWEVDISDEELKACEDELHDLKEELPGNCEVNTYEY